MPILRFTLLVMLQMITACHSFSQEKPQAKSSVTASPPACDCCVFDERKPTSWQTRIAPDTVTGTPLRISGTVYESDGKTPACNVLMYFYHTNAQGRYAKLGTEPRTSHAWWHGYCRGWLKTDDRGRYQLTTIKPVAYPNRQVPAHIHFYVKAPSQRTCYYLSDFVFTGDPFLTESYWYQLEQSDGFLRYGGVNLTMNHDTLTGYRDVHLLPQFDQNGRHSGLTVDQECPSFSPVHVWGPDKGKRTCPMCAYGKGQGVLIWTATLSGMLPELARFWEGQLRNRGPKPLKAFVIYTNPDRKPAHEVKSMLETFARQTGLREVAMLYVPSPDDKASAFLYNINPAASITVLAYRQRRVVGNWVDGAVNKQVLQQQATVLR